MTRTVGPKRNFVGRPYEKSLARGPYASSVRAEESVYDPAGKAY